MNYPFFIARRYLFSKKKTNVINVISLISVVGVAVATAALVVVMSVFNGFQDLVASFFTNVDPQLKVVPAVGKDAPADDPVLTQIRRQPEVEVATECVEDMALAICNGRQAMVTVKGVGDNFDSLTHISDILYGSGSYQLHTANLEFGIPGIRLAQSLGFGAYWDGYMKIYAARRQGQLDLAAPQEGFVVDSLLSPGVVFAVNQGKYDKRVIFTSLGFARNLFEREGRLTSLELRLKPGSDFDATKARMQKLAAGKFKVFDRYEQQADTFRIMQVEKAMAYLFLTFILIVACFNIIGSVSMLIIDKRDNIATLRDLGATDRDITRIFLLEGRMIAAIGALAGIAVGLLLCLLQQQYGIVPMGGRDASYIVSAYPCSVHYLDVLLIFVTVIVVSWLAVWYPVRSLSRRMLAE